MSLNSIPSITLIFISSVLLFFSYSTLDINNAYYAVIFSALVSIYCSNKTGSPIISLFTILFCFFFIGPLIIFGIEFLSQGTFFKQIYLNPERQFDLLISLNLFLISLSISILFFYKRKKERHEFSVGSSFSGSSNYLILLYSLAFYFAIFNIREMLAVFEAGYQVFQSGNLAFKKSFLEFFLEMALIILIAYGARNRNRHALIAGLIYALTYMSSGQRGPGFFLALTLILIYYPVFFRGKTILLTTLLGSIVGIPLVMFIQTLRVLGFDGVAKFDLAFYYNDIWNVIAYSFDTLKASFWYEGQVDLNISPFAKLLQVFDVALNRAFGYGFERESYGFAREFSSTLDPYLFETKGVTFASSGIAESYYFGGVFGVILYGPYVAFISNIFDKALFSKHTIIYSAILIFLPKYFVSVRNELLGWLYEGLVHFLILLAIISIIKFLFSKESKRLSIS